MSDTIAVPRVVIERLLKSEVAIYQYCIDDGDGHWDDMYGGCAYCKPRFTEAKHTEADCPIQALEQILQA